MAITLFSVIVQLRLVLGRTVVGDNNSMYPHPDDLTMQTADISEFKPFTKIPR